MWELKGADLKNDACFRLIHWNVQHTSKEMILQASFGHELVYQQPVITLKAIANKFNQIWVTKLAKIVDFCLQMIG